MPVSEEMPVGSGRLPARSVVESLRHAVSDAPDRTAIIYRGRILSYAEYGRSVAGLAERLRRVRGTDGPVAIVMPNSPEMSIATFAAWVAGAQVALLNPNYTARELRPLLAGAGPSAVVTLHTSREVPERLAAELGVPVVSLDAGGASLEKWLRDETLVIGDEDLPEPASLATLMYTGGTTGIPKGVNHTHRSLVLTVRGMEACWPTRLGEEVWLNVAPCFHIWGLLMGILNPVYGQATLVTAPGFVPEKVVSALHSHAVTVFGGGPAEIYGGLLSATNITESDLSSLRVCPGGGSRFSAALHQRWFAATGAVIYEAFGMTELAPISCNPSGLPPRAGSVGLPAPLVEIEVVRLSDGDDRALPVGEVGEIRVWAPHLTVGYSDREPESTHQLQAPEWLRTGDIGHLDEDGYLYIVDRKKDMIIVGGFNVYPREIDEILTSHKGVVDAATVGVASDRKGERPVSFVVPAASSSIGADELLSYCAKNLTKYKCPSEIVIVDQLPRTAANKVDRKALRAVAGARAQAQ